MTVFSGNYPPIPVPFREDESLDLQRLESNLQRWVSQPLAGVVCPGSNSEAAYLSKEEKLVIWKVCASVVKRAGKVFIAGTGVESTAETIELTRIAAEMGADASLVLPPYFYKPQMTHETLLSHYRALGDASTIPLFVYNVPQFTGVDFQPNTLISLADHPRIIGMKDSSANVVKIASVLSARPDFLVFAGTGSALLPFFSLGAIGGIMALANFAAEPLDRLTRAFFAGNADEARQIQLDLAPINVAVTSKYGVSGLKYAMSRCGFYGGTCRRPLLPLGVEGKKEIDRLLDHLGLLV